MTGDQTQDVFIVGASRSAIGSFGGSLKDQPPSRLGSLLIAESLRRSGFQPDQVEHVVVGQVIPSEPRDAYLARIAAIEAGIPQHVPALTVNRLCGSGLQAIVSAAQMVRLQECAVAVAGGSESMSRAPFVSTDLRWGRKMGNVTELDALLTSLQDPFGNGHMGLTAERVADRFGISRERQDQFALLSQQRASKAIAEGRFKSQILPIEISTRKGSFMFAEDEYVRADTTAPILTALKPAFKADGGSVTPGNASGINDGAAAVVIASSAAMKQSGAKAMARIVSWGFAGVAPEIMGMGPVESVSRALQRADLTVEDLDVIENNEAFAAQACAVADALHFPPEKVNPNGGAIALGHPVGATGAILVVKALYELERTGGRYALVTMCIGGGQGIAMILERTTDINH